MDNNKDIPNKKPEKQFKTDGGKTKSNAIEIPAINLPKGGGAIKGIDQKFSVNAVNGTSAFSIPLPVSQARGVAPALSLSYNSGAGNGIFGLGWTLSLPSIKRKTDKELPQYNDYIDSDTYLLSEAEDLVPEYERNTDGTFKLTGGNFTIKESSSIETGWVVRYYKPRIEGLFARIERWTKTSNGEIKWRVISKDNITTLYGWSSASRLADPADATKRIYEWLPELVFDDKGNVAWYKYKAEDATNIVTGTGYAHNRNRYNGSTINYTNLYLEKVLYGNKTPFYPYDSYNNTTVGTVSGIALTNANDFLFETALDYGQLKASGAAPYTTNSSWDYRSDAFSEYKAGFEIRTTRLCQRVLLIHHFTDSSNADKYLVGGHALVKSLDCTYGSNGNAGFTFLNRLTSKGYIKYYDSNNGNAVTYSSKSLPPMDFTYQAHSWNKEVKTLSSDSLLHAPVGLHEPYQFTDLYNEGLSGILSEQAGAWYYKRNLGGGEFEAAQLVSPKPAVNGLGQHYQLLDLDGDGVKQLVNFNSSPQGYYELKDQDPQIGGAFEPLQYFKTLPNINLNDPNARLLDLNGDGKTDVLITEEHVFTWWESAGREGFKDWHRTLKSNASTPLSVTEAEEHGPHVVFADKTQSIFLADMSGDGLTDIVRIRNGEVCYWPNLGYGKFGARVSMDNAPVFDTDADFNPAYLKIADIDGSGTPDLIYLGKNKFSCWLNHSGNSFATTPFEIDAFPGVHNQVSITVTDLLGTGLQCLVWSSALDKDKAAPLRYIDLMDSKKAHILVKHVNNMGLEVELEYTPSTKFYTDDKKAGRPWATRLHFPVYCVSKTITHEKLSGHTFTSIYSYHHGYYDHAEKEFRGFGRVDQLDTETFEGWKRGSLISGNTYNLSNDELQQAPVLTRSWFHTGAWTRDKALLDQYATEYWFEEYNRVVQPTTALSVGETALPGARVIGDGWNTANASYASNMSPVEKREAYRACKSMALRTEVFALDAPAGSSNSSAAMKKQLTPYSVATHNCMVELLQPAGTNKHAVFCVKESEAITYHYERSVSNPRVAHTLNLEMDQWGNVLKAASVVYPRQTPLTTATVPQEVIDAQGTCHITVTENAFTNDVDAASPNAYRLRLPSESKTWELSGYTQSNAPSYPLINNLCTTERLLQQFGAAGNLNYESVPTYPINSSSNSTAPLRKRLIEQVQSLYSKNDLSGALALGVLESRALPWENYQLAYTSALIGNIFTRNSTALISNAAALLGTEGKYYSPDSGATWWVRSGTVQYKTAGESETDAKSRFFTPIRYTDPFGSVTTVDYDSTFYLFVEETQDAAGNTNRVLNFDYRVLAPLKLKDLNDNESEVLLDELGLPKAMALYGKGSQGDYLTGLTAHSASEQATVTNYFAAANSSTTNYGNLESLANTLLQQATLRFVYDFDAYAGSGGTRPVVVSSIAREEHYTLNNTAPLQLSFEYSGGAGQVLMKKIQAEGGEAQQVTLGTGNSYSVSTVNTNALSPSTLRWIGNGKTVLNNKGKAVKQYEPYFSTTAAYESFKELVEQGVTPILYYDAVGRPVKTLMPDGSYSRVEFDNWKQVSYDANDTSGEAGNTWYSTQYGYGNNTPERDSALKAKAHEDTPQTQHLDSLGRPVLTVDEDENNLTYETRLELDVENNLRKVVDARGNAVMQYKYDLLGNMVWQQSMDSGKRWLLHNALGSPLRTWDERDFEVRFTYDNLHRPYEVKVLNGDGPTSLNNVVERYIYGDDSVNGPGSPENNNLRGQLYRHYDTGGLEEMATYDFKGHALSVQRWLAADYKNVVDWAAPSTLESSSYTISTAYDALGRIKLQTAPNNNTIVPGYNKRGLLVQDDLYDNVNIATHLANVNYDAKGQRTRVDYGNGTNTKYTYDAKTFRLKRLETKDSGGGLLQDLLFWYDAVGNITFKKDTAIPKDFYNNRQISATNGYIYDALYRLIEATGRENNAAVNFTGADNTDDSPFILSLNIGDPAAMQTYTQEYTYDKVGNITKLKHIASNQGSYTRDYEYFGNNNRLRRSTTDGGVSYYTYTHHSQHGFITGMPHLSVLDWNWKEEVAATSKQFVSPGDIPETTYYQYDSKGKRLRKITENASYSPGTGLTGPLPAPTPTLKNQRIYMEGYEYYEDFGSGEQTHSLSLIDEGRRFVMVEDSTVYGYLVRYQHPNHQGSCTLETDDIGRVITYEEYHPFGTTSYQATNAAITASYKRYRYTGMERDEETGLSYHNARYYIPWLGRWLKTDPVNLDDGVNVYTYCQNNPITFIDTEGTQTAVGTFVNTPTVNNQQNQKSDKQIRFEQLAQSISFMAEQAKNKSKPLAAPTGNNSIGQGTAGYADNQTQQRQFNDAVTASFVRLGLIPAESPAAKDDATGVKLSGFFKTLGALVEIAAGVLTSEFGVGTMIAAHGLDNLQAGLRQMVSGKETGALSQDLTAKGLEAIGYTKEEAAQYAEFVNLAVQILATEGLASGAGGASTGSKVIEASSAANKIEDVEITVYRVFGGDSRAQGRSWTPIDPRTVENFRASAGLPTGGQYGTNTADFMLIGKVKASDISKVRPALPLDGNPGGLTEYLIDPSKINLIDFKVLNP